MSPAKNRCLATLTAAKPKIEYLVQMPQPWTHYFSVGMTISGGAGGIVALVMPVWTPGSYVIREFARKVEGFSAADAAGAPLPWRKVAKNRWRIVMGKASSLKVAYRVHASERSVRTSHLDDTHGTINGASLFMYVEGRIEEPCRLRIEPFPSWNRMTTSLEPLKGRKNTFLAPDFDTLVDCPVEIGNHQVTGFTARNIPHTVAICGDGNHEPEKICADLRRLVECATVIFGGVPYSRYSFLIHLTSEGGVGLEHASSTLLQIARWSFRPDESYQRFLELAAHEYFHLWNGKRLRPAGLGPFDYSVENYTRQLWAVEGLTDYFSSQILLRAGFLTPTAYLDGISKSLHELQESPGRLVESVAEASFDVWVKAHRQDPDYPNRSVSCYLKGSLMGVILDLEIRKRGEGRSLDDVMRLLYRKLNGRGKRGYTEKDLRDACETVAGRSLGDFFRNYVDGTRELDLAAALRVAGLRFAGSGGAARTGRCYLGISTRTLDGKLLIVGVARNSPAYEQGLNVNDEILALDGYRTDQESLAARIGTTLPGARLELLVARDERLVSLPVVAGAHHPDNFAIEQTPEATPEQKRVYEQWLHTPWRSLAQQPR